jgi:ribosomal protein S18 acetylase RimI-like enzyme
MIRPFRASDERRVAEIWLKAGQDEYTYLPQFQALDEAKALQVFHKIITLKSDICVEENGLSIVGFIALQNSYIDRLYVDPEFQGQRFGSNLLGYAKAKHPTGLELCTHQQNRRACKFYEKHGFVAVRYGISPAPESVPDVEYHWRPD